MKYKCKTPGCDRRIGKDLLFCDYHWSVLSGEIRDEIYRASEAFHAVGVTEPGFNEVRVAYYLTAKRAIREVVEFETRLARSVPAI